LFEYFKEVLIDIINNITGGIIDFSITDNGRTHPRGDHSVISMASRKRKAIDLDTKHQIRSVLF
jgi:hypothetical protein